MQTFRGWCCGVWTNERTINIWGWWCVTLAHGRVTVNGWFSCQMCVPFGKGEMFSLIDRRVVYISFHSWIDREQWFMTHIFFLLFSYSTYSMRFFSAISKNVILRSPLTHLPWTTNYTTVPLISHFFGSENKQILSSWWRLVCLRTTQKGVADRRWSPPHSNQCWTTQSRFLVTFLVWHTTTLT